MQKAHIFVTYILMCRKTRSLVFTNRMICFGLELRMITTTTNQTLSLNFVTREVCNVACRLSFPQLGNSKDAYDRLKLLNLVINQAKILLAQDDKYKYGFKFEHVWPILKDMQKFTDNDTATSVARRESGHFVSPQEDTPTPESPTMTYPGLSSFSPNITSDDGGGSSFQQPMGVKKAKFKRRVEEKNSTICDT
ncbi:hypothetical protein Dsin_018191 [Dipteronia sinensis]|uniref:No apical meristem-associated C-terminal domain-containing protein n=1 Tax=Dipteronia sinensis TaxID=43782 RepID=A0AAE0E1J0_9ROSI|nr:hypothetical protein Dsin_018191 [Dipteronia sinensis]